MRGRFQKEIAKSAVEYAASIPFDWRLYRQDIAGSIAHAKMLAKQGIITDEEAKLINNGLISIQEEIEQGKFQFKIELEDIHMNVEARLFEKIGSVAGKLHTARSRNDQMALDLRFYVKEAILGTVNKLKELQRALLSLAESNKSIVMPGYTHLQQAQPVLLAHHLLAYFEMFQRDIERFQDCFKRADVMPLGSGALAGVAYPLDRDFVAQELGFSCISTNSLDAVSDRDFIAEYEAAAALTAMHLSRLAEEMVLWSSTEFGFIEIDDAYTTGSSIMPQKKNPDIAELARGKTGRIYGNLIGMLTIMKALPLTYSRDLQEDKEGLFDTIDTLQSTLGVFAEMVLSITVNAKRIGKVVAKDYILATDLADYLVKKGMPFREAHSSVSKLVRYAIEQGKSLHKLGLSEYQKLSPLFAEDVYAITPESSIASKNIIGGTAPEQVKAALKRAKKILEGKS